LQTSSEVLADFVARQSYSGLPPEVVVKAKLHLLDLLGVALASSTMPFGASAWRAARSAGGTGQATVIGFSERLWPAWAALVNGTLAHGTDFDDTHQASVVHVSTSVVPAALAAAEAAGADGERFVTALAIGMESAVRIGLVARGGFHDRGFHPTGICGTYAAALTAGWLAGLDAGHLADAVGLSGSMAAGSLEFLTDGSAAKRVHGGWAAHGGLTAAELAREGFSGPRAVFEGRFGLYRSHLGDEGWDVGVLTKDLGRCWEMLDIALKPYPCCHFTHAFIDCAARVRDDLCPRVEEIARVDCFIAPREMPVVCEPRATKCAPQNDYDAKFSLPYAVACMLLRGHVDLDDFTPEAIRNPAVLDLAARVDCHPDSSADYPRHFPGRLRVTLGDGRSFECSEPINRGGPERPLSLEEVREKYRRNACRALPPRQVAALMDAVERIDRLPSVRAIGDLLGGAPAGPT
jgi:2-methylcitrate dehydratase PrpD